MLWVLYAMKQEGIWSQKNPERPRKKVTNGNTEPYGNNDCRERGRLTPALGFSVQVNEGKSLLGKEKTFHQGGEGDTGKGETAGYIRIGGFGMAGKTWREKNPRTIVLPLCTGAKVGSDGWGESSKI